MHPCFYDGNYSFILLVMKIADTQSHVDSCITQHTAHRLSIPF